MDDVRIQMIRAAADPGSNIARMVEWLRTYKGRVITSRAHPDFPCLEEFPLEEVLDALPLRLLQLHGRLRRRLRDPHGRDEDHLLRHGLHLPGRA
jgi:hypothetical protein